MNLFADGLKYLVGDHVLRRIFASPRANRHILKQLPFFHTFCFVDKLSDEG